MWRGKVWGGFLAAALALSVGVSSAGAEPPVPPLPEKGPIEPPSHALKYETLPYTGGDPSPTFLCATHDWEPSVCRQGSFYAQADYLLLRARRPALDIAIVDPVATIPRGSIESADWGTRSGMRFELGYQTDAGLCLGASYTYFHTVGNRVLNAPAGGVLLPTLTVPQIDQVDAARASSNLDLDVFDIQVGHTITVNDDLDLCVFAGGRFADIQQKLNAVYSGGVIGALRDTVSAPISIDGAGIRIGGEGHMKLGGGFSFYAKAAGSLLAGHLSTSTRETLDGNTPVVNVAERRDDIFPVAELGLGVSWQTNQLRVTVGYEMANWYNMVNSVDFVEGSGMNKTARRTGDLSLEGLALQVGWRF
jgi:hypothetical protein